MPITSSSRPVSSAKDCCSPSPSHIPGSSGPPSDPGCAPSAPGSRLPNSSSQPRYASGFLNFSWIPRNTTSSRNSSPNERIPIKCRASASQLEKNSGKTPDSQERYLACEFHLRFPSIDQQHSLAGNTPIAQLLGHDSEVAPA